MLELKRQFAKSLKFQVNEACNKHLSFFWLIDIIGAKTYYVSCQDIFQYYSVKSILIL